MRYPLVTLLFALGATSACTVRAGSGNGATAANPMTRGYGPEVISGFERVRASTARFASLDSVVAAGYPREVAQCVQHADHATRGAMGYHHVKRAIVDTLLEIERPEIIIYEKLPDGAYRMTGVEYIVPYRLRPRESPPPKIMGLDLKREDNLNLWYLHFWVWKENPAGLFADYSPAIACPRT